MSNELDELETKDRIKTMFSEKSESDRNEASPHNSPPKQQDLTLKKGRSTPNLKEAVENDLIREQINQLTD